MKAYPSHYNEWLILISIVSDQLLICKFAVFTYFLLYFYRWLTWLALFACSQFVKTQFQLYCSDLMLMTGNPVIRIPGSRLLQCGCLQEVIKKWRFHCVNIAAPSLFLLFVTCIHFSIFPSCAQMWPGFGGHLSFLPQIRTICSEFLSCHLLDHK